MPTPEATPAAPAAPAQTLQEREAAAAKAKAEASRGGAKVLGRIDLGTIEDRIGERQFKPASERNERDGGGGRNTRGRPDKAPGRQTFNRNDLYGGRGRGNKRNKKNKGRDRRGEKPKKTEITVAAEHKRVIKMEDAITVGDLGRQMGVKAGHLALKLMQMGVPAMVNTTLDFETASLVAEEFNHTVENVAFDIEKFYDTTPDAEDTLKPRPAVVTVMGHVDHGKTSLLDAIRATSVTSGEAGGITQHIGAYTVETESGETVTFLDTPGHEAFTALRARGAQATDIVVLVIAADDGVMPQTVEAINHSRDAGVPIIVAINKIDKPAANPDRIKTALSEYELLPTDWGGSTEYALVSALQGQGIDELVEIILLTAEVEELKARPDRDAQGLVIESQLDVGRGPLATVLVQRGTLAVGDIVVIGEHSGRVRTMADHRGTSMEVAGPSVPVEITGLSGVPDAGEPFFVVEDDKDARRITAHVAEAHRKERMAALSKSGMDKLLDLLRPDANLEHKKLKLIVKADVQGSIEALEQAFQKIGNDEVSVEVIHSAVGGVTENDVNLAASSSDSAVAIIGFNVRPDPRAAEVAEKYGIQIFSYNIIYDAIDTIRDLLTGMLKPLEQEEVLGRAEVRETFSAPKVGTIAGCYVTDGLLRRNAKARLLRNGAVIYTSTLGSLRRFKDDVREVKSGFECGTSLENYNDIKVGDIIEAFEIKEVAATL